jgi:hypothetical protein
MGRFDKTTEELLGSYFFTSGAEKARLKIRDLAAGAIFSALERLPERVAVARKRLMSNPRID